MDYVAYKERELCAKLRVGLSLLEEVDKIREQSERGGHEVLQVGCYCRQFRGGDRSAPTACVWCRVAVFVEPQGAK